jgi:hypothetical protein
LAAGELSPGDPYTIVATNAAGDAIEQVLATNDHIADGADIEVSKLDPGANDESVLVSNGVVVSSSRNPAVHSLAASRYLKLEEYADPGDSANGNTLWHDSTASSLRAGFASGYRHDIAPDNPFVSGWQAKHFDELYAFAKTSGNVDFTTETYAAPFGLTHATAFSAIVSGFLVASVVRNAATGSGVEILAFGIKWHTNVATPIIYQGSALAGSGSGISIVADGTNAVFRTSGDSGTKVRVRLFGEVFVSEVPA